MKYSRLSFEDHLVKVQGVGVGFSRYTGSGYSDHIVALIPPFTSGVYVSYSVPDMVFFEHCQPCAAFSFGQCPGGYRQIKDNKCARKVSLKETPGLLEVTFQPHAYVIQQSERRLYMISLAEKPTGNLSEDLRLTPYYTGHVHSSGNICTGTITTSREVRVFATDYLKIWAALHTGHLWPSGNMKKSMSLANLIRNMSIDFIKAQAVKHGFNGAIERTWKDCVYSSSLSIAAFENTFVKALYKMDWERGNDPATFYASLGIDPNYKEQRYFIETEKDEVICLDQFSSGSTSDYSKLRKEVPDKKKKFIPSEEFHRLLKDHGTYAGGIK